MNVREMEDILGIPRDMTGAEALFGRSPFEFEEHETGRHLGGPLLDAFVRPEEESGRFRKRIAEILESTPADQLREVTNAFESAALIDKLVASTSSAEISAM